MEENRVDASYEEATTAAPEEKILTQSQVNAIVQREKQQATARAEQRVEQKYQQQAEQLQQQPAMQEAQQQAPKSPQIDAETMYQQLQERMNADMQQKQLESEISQVATNYLHKMSSGKDSYEDFDEVTASFDPSAFPQLVYLVAGIDNAAEVIYELSKNPSKLVTLDTLALKSPKHAQAELARLSKSISDNRQAQTEASGQQVNAPLDRMQPSRVSSGGGPLSINDLRNQPWLKG